MDLHSQDFFYTRASVPALHEQSIHNEASAIQSDISKLIRRVFAHLPAVFATSMPPAFPKDGTNSDEAIPSTSWLAWLFYTRGYYCDIEIRRDAYGPQVSPDELIKEFCTFAADPNRNQLFFLRGSIGSGKTAFINYMITKYGWKVAANKHAWFLRLNVDVHRDRGPDPVRSLFVDLCNKLTRVIQKICKPGGAPDTALNFITLQKFGNAVELLKTAVNDPDRDQPKLAFFYASQQIGEILGRRLLLVLDNLDWYFHENDRYLFMSDVDSGEGQQLSVVHAIVREFYHGNSLNGDLGANILFVLREDSYSTLRESRVLFPGTDGPYSDNRNLFTIIPPDWNDVIAQRTGLLREAVKAIRTDGLRKSVGAALEPVVQALHAGTSAQPLIGHLKAMVPFGLRSVMEFFEQYSWLNKEEDAETVSAAQRYLEHYPVGLICFMLRGYRLFSQENSRFPNIYFVNARPDDEERTRSALQNRVIDAHEARVSHPHTYWLKRLLLCYLKKCNSSDESVRTRDVVDLFCTGDGAYENGLVRLCLGSFAQTHASNLIEPVRQISGDETRLVISNILLTERGRHCLENVFDRFFYLQLVVDDFALPVPRKFQQSFRYDPGLHYGYLVKAGTEYSEGLGRMIAIKTHQVTRLLSVLSEAYECEEELYRPVFDRLRRREVELPDMAQIVSHYWNELTALERSRHVPKVFSVDELKVRFNEWRDELRPILRLAYRV